MLSFKLCLGTGLNTCDLLRLSLIPKPKLANPTLCDILLGLSSDWWLRIRGMGCILHKTLNDILNMPS